MITMTAQQAIFYIILSPIALIIILMAIVVMKRSFSRYSRAMNHKKLHKEMTKGVEDMKKNGGFHEWIQMPISATEKAYVCKKTGFCPTHDAFVSPENVKNFLREQANTERYDKFKSQKLTIIAAAFGLKLDEIDTITKEIIAIPQQYTVGRLQELEDELKATGKEKDLNEKAN
jgi:hypothetical protein